MAVPSPHVGQGGSRRRSVKSKTGHPRESGDPVNAGEYWIPAFAGMTRNRKASGRYIANADQVRRADGAEEPWAKIRLQRSRSDAVRLWNRNGRRSHGREGA